MTREKKPKIDRRDWRNLPYSDWNTLTVHAYFADMNREMYGAEPYLPMRNWAVERGMIKRALAEHGAELLKRAFDVIFREYRPTREYPILTAGFALSYRVNTVLPRVAAEARRATVEDAEKPSVDEIRAWL
ncbi:hypothetical protein [Paenibacillus naphthalenovorans]|uniref:hypothetical protein n=1 Tax=Paenibacillus naphthalenovorans TaxID=162209 RepID=UPI003D288AB7